MFNIKIEYHHATEANVTFSEVILTPIKTNIISYIEDLFSPLAYPPRARGKWLNKKDAHTQNISGRNLPGGNQRRRSSGGFRLSKPPRLAIFCLGQPESVLARRFAVSLRAPSTRSPFHVNPTALHVRKYTSKTPAHVDQTSGEHKTRQPENARELYIKGT